MVRAAVGEKVLVYADDVALHQRIGPVAADDVGLELCAAGEVVVLAGRRNGGKKVEGLEGPRSEETVLLFRWNSSKHPKLGN